MNAPQKVAVTTGVSGGIGTGLVRGFLDRGVRPGDVFPNPHDPFQPPDLRWRRVGYLLEHGRSPSPRRDDTTTWQGWGSGCRGQGRERPATRGRSGAGLTDRAAPHAPTAAPDQGSPNRPAAELLSE
jgi:hypothetical protein